MEENNYVIEKDSALLLDNPFVVYNNEDENIKRYHRVNCIYLFINKEIPGIMFYDKSLSNGINSIIKWKGKFITEQASISEAIWDDKINILNKTMVSRNNYGEMIINTFMISKEQMFNVLNTIKNAKNPNYIVIDIGLKLKFHHKKAKKSKNI